MLFKATILAACAALAAAAPLDVWSPPIISPNAATIWTIGTQVNVTWDTSTKPVHVTNQFGQVYIVQNGVVQTDGPLATGFPLTQGWVTVTVPQVPADTYEIILFGDSSNVSPPFQVVEPL